MNLERIATLVKVTAKKELEKGLPIADFLEKLGELQPRRGFRYYHTFTGWRVWSEAS